ncbi:MAG TPA: rod shape-determining protein MreC [Gammaproteobacteria bacterium]|jgi:rod shape-determining protein MreC|nr:rod shape-determining protein MreC [Gammaproteobacteria bacterium]|tara:strand:- start:2546 stop:3427 length:882 start_codon:yes stop_codon:yes gene_type:complete
METVRLKPASRKAIIGLLPYVLLSVLLMVADRHSDSVRQATHAVAVVGIPVHFLATLPTRTLRWMEGSLESPQELKQQYAVLQEKHLILQTRLQRYELLEVENARLRRLLSAIPTASEQVLLARLIDVDLDPRAQDILIDKGSADGVFDGQPVVDGGGIVGQVTAAGLFRSAVRPVTDLAQAVPVQVLRNGLRAVVYGGGRGQLLRVLYLDRNADIRVGDLLASSGLGGRYPVGYPVAQVKTVERNLSESFMTVRAKPASQLGSEREVALLWLTDGRPSNAGIPAEVGNDAGD